MKTFRASFSFFCIGQVAPRCIGVDVRQGELTDAPHLHRLSSEQSFQNLDALHAGRGGGSRETAILDPCIFTSSQMRLDSFMFSQIDNMFIYYSNIRDVYK